MPDLPGERIDYDSVHLLEADAPADPYQLFERWLIDAFAAKDRGVLPEPTAMVVATSIEDRPGARTVLLKGFDAEGFVFFTNYKLPQGRGAGSEPVHGAALRLVPAASPGPDRGRGRARGT